MLDEIKCITPKRIPAFLSSKREHFLAGQALDTGCKMEPFSFLFIGDTHGAVDDFQKQKEIIEAYDPEVVLAESLQDIRLDTPRKFKESLEKRIISDTVRFDEVKKLIELCQDRGVRLIGIDFHNFGLTGDLKNAVEGKPTNAQKKEIQEIVKKRQNYHLKKIQGYQRKTKKPVVIIIGAWHLQENSLLMTGLTDYKVIFPCDSRGTILIGPTKGKIQYSERIKR